MKKSNVLIYIANPASAGEVRAGWLALLADWLAVRCTG